MKVTCHQTAPIYGEPEKNLDEIERLIASTPSDIHVFSELALTGYLFDTKADIAKLAQPISGGFLQRLSKFARQQKSAIVTGFMESDEGKFYNSSVLIDTDGTLALVYRKVHLFDREKLLFEPGDRGFPVKEISVGAEAAKIGMMICYDWRFPEATRSLAINGAQLVCAPSNIVTTTQMRMPIRRTRAFENKIYLAFADRVGEETIMIDGATETIMYQGCSAIIAPNGDILQSLNETETASITAEINPAMTSKKMINSRNDILADRRPEAYR
jgi:predicted amidohydrolase